MSDFSPTQTQRLYAVAGSSDLIFIGTVRGVGPAPLAWAGQVPSYQSVTYAVD